MIIICNILSDEESVIYAQALFVNMTIFIQIHT